MNWKKNIVTFIVIFLGVMLLSRSCVPRQSPNFGRPDGVRIVTVTLEGKPDRLAADSYGLQAEVADTVEQRRAGLSGRPGLEPGYAKLYVYAEPQVPEFSEAGTRMPLSVAFIRGDGTIAEIRDVAAGSEEEFEPQEPVRFVLEARQGWFADRGAGPGSRLILPGDLVRASGEEAAAVPADTPVD
jgi:uncharacterized membrane protein (UPF0127 family)